MCQELDGAYGHRDGGLVVAEQWPNTNYAEHGYLALQPGLVQEPGHRLVEMSAEVGSKWGGYRRVLRSCKSVKCNM